MCLLHLNAPADALTTALLGSEIEVEAVGSTYRIAAADTSGFFKTSQDADTLLSGVDFNNTGGPLLFNHNSGIATDGTRLVMADTFNNRRPQYLG